MGSTMPLASRASAAPLAERGAAPPAAGSRPFTPRSRAVSWRSVLPLAAAMALGLGSVGLVWLLGRPLLLLVLAVTLAAALAPLAESLDRRLPRTLAVALVYAGLAGVVVLLAWFVLPTLAREMQDLVRQLPDIVSRLQQRLQHVLPAGAGVQGAIADTLKGWGQQLLSFPVQVMTFALELLIIIFLSLYFLMAGPRIRRFVLSLLPRAPRRRASRVLDATVRAMGGYFRAATIDAAIIAVLTWVSLTILGMPFRMPLAVLAGLGEFVPFVGPIVAAIPAIAVAALSSTQQVIVVALVYLAIQQIESHVVTPVIMHSQTDIAPATVLFAVTAGFAMGGVLGAIAAIPLFAAARVLVLRVLAPCARRAAGAR